MVDSFNKTGNKNTHIPEKPSEPEEAENLKRNSSGFVVQRI